MGQREKVSLNKFVSDLQDVVGDEVPEAQVAFRSTQVPLVGAVSMECRVEGTASTRERVREAG